MGVKTRHKTCAVAGCDVSINSRARTNVCVQHKHTDICNCTACRTKPQIEREGRAQQQPSALTLPEWIQA